MKPLCVGISSQLSAAAAPLAASAWRGAPSLAVPSGKTSLPGLTTGKGPSGPPPASSGGGSSPRGEQGKPRGGQGIASPLGASNMPQGGPLHPGPVPAGMSMGLIGIGIGICCMGLISTNLMLPPKGMGEPGLPNPPPSTLFRKGLGPVQWQPCIMGKPPLLFACGDGDCSRGDPVGDPIGDSSPQLALPDAGGGSGCGNRNCGEGGVIAMAAAEATVDAIAGEAGGCNCRCCWCTEVPACSCGGVGGGCWAEPSWQPRACWLPPPSVLNS
mmetsp:Transcript_115769/g.291264  ORF Transcript_115769/g.291264 Transcript_115769/m.291264 type:complete len:271 (-) Transcript_115769:2080-2892(-)